MTLQLYFDEDAGQCVVVQALREAGFGIVTTSDAGMLGCSDEEQLYFATSRGLVAVSQNVQHFYRLHTDWLQAGRSHAGMILIHQARLPVGERIRRLRRMCVELAPEQMRDRAEFLSGWD